MVERCCMTISTQSGPTMSCSRCEKHFHHQIRSSGGRTVQVYHSAEPDKLLTADDALDGEDVVPGFKLPLSQVFK
jgi:hypothetical protein